MKSMYLTDINTRNIDDEIIRRVLFSSVTVEYLEADCLILFGCHIKLLLDERIDLAINILHRKRLVK